MKGQLSLVFIASLLASAAAVNKIKCYSCNSETDPNCNDPLNTDVVKAKECTNDVTNTILNGLNAGLKGLSNFFQMGSDKTTQIDANFVCMKASYTKKGDDGNDKKLVVRSCVLESAKICDNLNQNLKDKGHSEVFCGECNSDECNGSYSLSPAAFILVPAIALILARM